MKRLIPFLTILLVPAWQPSASADFDSARGPGRGGEWRDGRGHGDGRGDGRRGPGRDWGRPGSGHGPRPIPGYPQPGPRPIPGPGFPAPRYPFVEVVRVGIGYTGVNQLSLDQLAGLYRFQGYRLVGVVVNASSRFGQGILSLCTQGCSTVRLGTMVQGYRLPTTGSWIDGRAAAWYLSLTGNIYVDSIQLELQR